MEHGQVGQVVCPLLDRNGCPYVAADNDAAAVPEHPRQGSEVYYGDAIPEFLKNCGLMNAKAVIITGAAAHVIEDLQHDHGESRSS
jgi:K+:H+ antiporter